MASHAAFGFVSAPRNFNRDAMFTGSSSNPSKRATLLPRKAGAGGTRPGPPASYAAAPAEPVALAAPGALSPEMLLKRCEYLEGQVRKLNAMVVDQGDLIRDSAGTGMILKATVVQETLEFPGETAQAAVRSRGVAVAAGETVCLVWPMDKARLPGGEEAVVMQRLAVDPDTAQLTLTWLVLHMSSGEDGQHLVSDFRLH